MLSEGAAHITPMLQAAQIPLPATFAAPAALARVHADRTPLRAKGIEACTIILPPFIVLLFPLFAIL